MVIYALVEASSQEEALRAARGVFDRLVGDTPHLRPVFDYYVTFDREDTAFAGQARWGSLPVAAPVASPQGRELVERGWNTTEAAFERHLTEVKEALDEYTDEEIMRDEGFVRHAFRQLGAYVGPAITLYDQQAMGIRDRDRLDELLAESDELWVVPADVHF
jgi:cell wall-associated NlpC family hydrolase